MVTSIRASQRGPASDDQRAPEQVVPNVPEHSVHEHRARLRMLGEDPDRGGPARRDAELARGRRSARRRGGRSRRRRTRSGRPDSIARQARSVSSPPGREAEALVEPSELLERGARIEDVARLVLGAEAADRDRAGQQSGPGTRALGLCPALDDRPRMPAAGAEPGRQPVRLGNAVVVGERDQCAPRGPPAAVAPARRPERSARGESSAAATRRPRPHARAAPTSPAPSRCRPRRPRTDPTRSSEPAARPGERPGARVGCSSRRRPTPAVRDRCSIALERPGRSPTGQTV